MNKFLKCAVVSIVCLALLSNPFTILDSNAGAYNDLVKETTGMDSEPGGFIVDNTGDLLTGKIDELAGAQGETLLKNGLQSFKTSEALRNSGLSNSSNYFRNRTNEFSKAAGNLRVGRQFLAGAGQVLNIYNTVNDTRSLIFESSKHETSIEAGIDKTLGVIDAGMGWYAIILGAGAIIAAPTVGAGLLAAGAVTGSTYFYTKLTVGATRIAFNSDTYRDISGFARGTKKIVFAPFTRPDVKEGLDIIKEDLGFDLYPGLSREIPDPATGIPVYKPNIYIYSDKDTELNLYLFPANRITKSIPAYDESNGWNAKIIDGSLNGNSGYLFYEAVVPDEGFQKTEGFIIKHSTAIKDMQTMMAQYGFTAKETADFTEYWATKLSSGKDYVFYPQTTQTVDWAMPLVTDKQADNEFRLWFYITQAKAEMSVKAAKVSPIERGGLTIVEWGGMIG